MSLHYFVVEPEQPLFRIPLRVMEELPEYRAALHEYAGKRIRVVEVRTIDEPKGVPEQIGNISGFYLHFDQNGLLQKDLYDEWITSAIERMSVDPTKDENVVQLEGHAKRRESERKHEWKPTQQEMTSIIDAALGHPKAIKNVKSTKLKKPPEPELSYETRSAYDAIGKGISKITFATFQLDEGELLGLQQMIQEKLEKIDPPHIWRGVMAENVEALKLWEARRTGFGEWIASVEIMKWNLRENEARSIKCWSERHPTREAALDAAKRLTNEHSSEMTVGTSLEARIVSALEWTDYPAKEDDNDAIIL